MNKKDIRRLRKALVAPKRKHGRYWSILRHTYRRIVRVSREMPETSSLAEVIDVALPYKENATGLDEAILSALVRVLARDLRDLIGLQELTHMYEYRMMNRRGIDRMPEDAIAYYTSDSDWAFMMKRYPKRMMSYWKSAYIDYTESFAVGSYNAIFSLIAKGVDFTAALHAIAHLNSELAPRQVDIRPHIVPSWRNLKTGVTVYMAELNYSSYLASAYRYISKHDKKSPYVPLTQEQYEIMKNLAAITG